MAQNISCYNNTFSIFTFSKYFPQAPGSPGKGQRLAFGFPTFDGALRPCRPELGQRREALSVEPPFWDPSQPVGGRPLADGGAGSLEDELHVAGILTPLVEGHHRVFMWSQVALCVSPFLNQSVSASPSWWVKS